jgi:hypothetical protein
MREMKNANIILVRKPERYRPLGRGGLEAAGRIQLAEKRDR